MRIGLDARHLTHPQEGGFKTYTQSLVSAITRVDTTTEYMIYVDRPVTDALPSQPNVEVRVVQGSLPVREQVALPIALARDRVDLIHCMCNTAPLLMRCPLVVTIHDVIPCLPETGNSGATNRRTRLLDKYWREVIPLAATRAAKIITVSESSAQDIQKILGVSPNRIQAVHNGIDSAFRPIDAVSFRQQLRNLDVPAARFILGFMSKDSRKNVVGLLQAFETLSKHDPDCGLVLVGSSRDAISALPEQTLTNPRISVMCSIPKKDLVALYNSASLLLFPSFAEGFGLPIVEAMACGTPVVTSDIASAREVAGDAAIFVDPHNTHGLAEAALAVLKSEALRDRMRGAGFKRAEKFSWDESARTLVATYQEVIGAVAEPSRVIAEQSNEDIAADASPQFPEAR